MPSLISRSVFVKCYRNTGGTTEKIYTCAGSIFRVCTELGLSENAE